MPTVADIVHTGQKRKKGIQTLDENKMRYWVILFFVLQLSTSIKLIGAIKSRAEIEHFNLSDLNTLYKTINQQKKYPSEFDNLQFKDLDNKSVTLGELLKNDSVLVISFWATWCKPCMEELNAINENLDEWNEKANFRFIAVSVDDARSGTKVKSMVNGRGWDFSVFKDQNQDLKRFFGINNLPSVIILKHGKVVSRHVGYTPGNETGLFVEIEKLNE